MKRITKEESIIRIMNGLKCNREEAEEIYNYDKAVDREERTEYDLTPEQQKIAQKFTHAGVRKKPMIPNLTPRKKKPNVAKEQIIAGIADFLENNFQEIVVNNLKIVNKERQIYFESEGERYELTLVKKAKPKS